MLTNRPAVLDGLLFATAVGALVLGAWPADVPRQTIRVRAKIETAENRSYSLAVSDPRLLKLKRRLARWGRVNSPITAESAVAKWRLETARFYAECSRRDAAQAGQEKTAAQGTNGRLATSDDSLQSSAMFWLDRANAVGDELAKLESLRLERQRHAAPPPVELGPVVEPPRNLASLGFAGLSAALGFFLHAIWNRASPAVELLRSLGAVPDSRWAAPGALALDIPASWVRVRQPVSVRIRQLCLSLIVLAAFVLWLV